MRFLWVVWIQTMNRSLLSTAGLGYSYFRFWLASQTPQHLTDVPRGFLKIQQPMGCKSGWHIILLCFISHSAHAKSSFTQTEPSLFSDILLHVTSLLNSLKLDPHREAAHRCRASFYLGKADSIRLLACLMQHQQRSRLYSLILCHCLRHGRCCNTAGQKLLVAWEGELCMHELLFLPKPPGKLMSLPEIALISLHELGH